MRFRVVENIITEGIDQVRKMFPNISDEDFDRVIRLDPTFQDGKDSVGTYGKWLLNLFNKGKLDNEGHITDVLTRFEQEKKNLKNKDIGQFKSIEEVDTYLNNPDNYNVLSDRQKLRQTQKSVRNTDIDRDAKKVFETDDWVVYIPLTYEASCKLGRGTSWCTATTETDHYYEYYSNQGPLYIIINKYHNEEKYQFHFPSTQYMDANDSSIDIAEFLENDEDLKDFFQNIIVADLEIPKEFRNSRTVEMTFKIEDFQTGFTSARRGDRYVSGADAYDILTNPFEYFYEGYYDDSDLDIADPDYLPYSENVNKLLNKLGLTLNDIKNVVQYKWVGEEELGKQLEEALSRAVSAGSLIGSVEEGQKDVIETLDECFDSYGIFMRYNSNDNIFIRITYDNFISFLMSSEEDSRDFYSIQSLLNEIIMNNLYVKYPKYGWNGFSEEAFNKTLEDELKEIEVHNEI